MNKFKTSVQCPECQGYGFIKIEKSSENLNSCYTSFKQCVKCQGFGTILVDKEEFEDV